VQSKAVFYVLHAEVVEVVGFRSNEESAVARAVSQHEIGRFIARDVVVEVLDCLTLITRCNNAAAVVVVVITTDSSNSSHQSSVRIAAAAVILLRWLRRSRVLVVELDALGVLSLFVGERLLLS
jgi:hypothetical protein